MGGQAGSTAVPPQATVVRFIYATTVAFGER
jgi:hypothetical protein